MDNIKRLDQRIELLRPILGFEGVTFQQLREIADCSFEKSYSKGELIFDQGEKCEFFYIVMKGLVKVSIYGSSGNKITYLLAGTGEPLNLVGPFTGNPRYLSAESIENTSILLLRNEDFLAYTYRHPVVIKNIMSILGYAIDSANDKILDMIEKRVEQRLIKVLHTLQKKFGQRLKFTSRDFAELAGTTTESTLRAMAQFRKRGMIKSNRGEIIILDPGFMENQGFEVYWV
ncbi:MAG: Crp/Fnr family transcriptional regulator [Deltaproteobacteria bacterium]|nr:Crp/Fnr family transcriptional regulator [Deltaproteobacteria bacterium]